MQSSSGLTRAFDEAWIDVQKMVGSRPLDPTGLRSLLAKRILTAAATGERDPGRLKLLLMLSCTSSWVAVPKLLTPDSQ